MTLCAQPACYSDVITLRHPEAGASLLAAHYLDQLSVKIADALLMHPLPHKHEMGTRDDPNLLDIDPCSVYFQQMENGMYVRMALLAKVLRGAHV